nr:MAG TPA: hypothetical protein [Caudoviricetes sp.]
MINTKQQTYCLFFVSFRCLILQLAYPLRL